MENISPALLDWFYKNRRSLPFREDPTPYHVWLSEVMLQQTRVSAVLPYYYRFLEELPDIPALAACEEEKLHKLWEGLGLLQPGAQPAKRLQARLCAVRRAGCPQTTPPACAARHRGVHRRCHCVHQLRPSCARRGRQCAAGVFPPV